MRRKGRVRGRACISWARVSAHRLERACRQHAVTPRFPHTTFFFPQVFDAVHYYVFSREAYDTEFSYYFEILRVVHMLRAQPPLFVLQFSPDPAPFYPAPAANPYLAPAAPPAAAIAAVAAMDVDTEEESDSDEEH
jgi:hypothetical protein